MKYIRSIIFKIWYVVWTILTCITLLPTLLSKKHTILPGRMWAYGIFWGLKNFVSIKYAIRGKEYFDKNKVVIYAVKHQSAWETGIFFILLSRPAYVIKEELANLLLVGWHMRAMGMINVERDAGAKAMKKMLSEAKARVNAGRSIVIFPEGNRKKIGDELDYKPGVAGLYKYLNIPVIPVCLNSGYYWHPTMKSFKPGIIVMEFLPPIEPGLSKEEFMQKLEEAIEKGGAKLLDEAAS